MPDRLRSVGLRTVHVERMQAFLSAGSELRIHTATGSRWASSGVRLARTCANVCVQRAKTLSCGWSSGLDDEEEIMRKRDELVVMHSLHQGTAKRIADLFFPRDVTQMSLCRVCSTFSGLFRSPHL